MSVGTKDNDFQQQNSLKTKFIFTKIINLQQKSKIISLPSTCPY